MGKRVRSNVVLRSFRFSMIWALSIQYWIDHRSYQWRKSNIIPGVVQYVPLGSSLCLSFSSAVKSASSSCAGSTSVLLYFLEAFPRHQKGSFRSGYDIVADATHNFSNFKFGSIILVDLFFYGSATDWPASKNHHTSLNLTWNGWRRRLQLCLQCLFGGASGDIHQHFSWRWMWRHSSHPCAPAEIKARAKDIVQLISFQTLTHYIPFHHNAWYKQPLTTI